MPAVVATAAALIAIIYLIYTWVNGVWAKSTSMKRRLQTAAIALWSTNLTQVHAAAYIYYTQPMDLLHIPLLYAGLHSLRARR
jgi:hypothetical protein